jgi:O-antigen biosynthesis protein
VSTGSPLAIAVRTVDVSVPLAPMLDVTGYAMTRVFVSDGADLIGSVDIGNAHGPISVTRLRDAIAAGLAFTLMKRGVEQQLGGIEPARSLPPGVRVSIVIATCNRPDDLRRCLRTVRQQRTSRSVEIIVVDNRPGASSPTPAVVAEFGGIVRVDEPRPGLSYARNAGVAAATGDIVIATDDDVTMPADWLERLLAPFARPEVVAVTGHVLPIELETTSQFYFEAYGGLGKGFTRLEADGDWFRQQRGAVPTWKLGATANAAFRAAIFRDPRIGVLDEALGAGTPTGCGEDTYLFYRILKAGHTIAYEPNAWVWHRHRRDAASLRHQIYSYSKGHTAYHLTTLLRDGDRRALVRLFYSLPKHYLKRAYGRIRGWSDYPMSLILIEIGGTLVGPWALWQARRRARKLGPSARPGAQDEVSAAGRQGAATSDPAHVCAASE